MKHIFILIFAISSISSLAMEGKEDLTAQERYQSTFWARRTQGADYKNFLVRQKRKQRAEQVTPKKEVAHQIAQNNIVLKDNS